MSPDLQAAEGACCRAFVLLEIQRWHRLGLLDASTRVTLVRYERSRLGLEVPATPAAQPPPRSLRERAVPPPRPAPAPAPAVEPTPAPPPVVPLAFPEPAPAEGASSVEAVGRFLRERVWWLVGAGLTVLGSFFVAGTVWGDLSGALRLLLLLGGLGAYTLGFARLGHRLSAQPGGRRAGHWLLGVAVALGPVLGMTAGSGWSLPGAGALFSVPALAAVAGFLAWRLPRDLAPLLPSPDRGFLALFGALAVCVGLLPLAPGAAWLLLPAGLGAVGLWWALTRWRRLPPAVGLLALEPLVFHAYLAPVGWSGAYAPTAALAALALLYVDSALGRWRGVPALGLRGLRGVLALGLAGLALLLLLPGFQPLPSGPESSLCGSILVPFFLGAALAWRRPVLVYGALLAALVATLALPDLFWAAVEPFLRLAGAALGYDDEPLPLAWYSLTLLPYLLACRLAAWGLARSGWRQASDLAERAWRWTFGLSLLLLLVAHTRGDDLRPALLAVPLHGLLWLRERRVRALACGILPWVGLLTWSADLLLHLAAGPVARLLLGAGLVLALVPAARWLAGRLRQAAVLDGARIVALPAALVLPALLRGWEQPDLALALAGGVLSGVGLALRPARLAPTPALVAIETGAAWLGLALLVAGGLCWAVPLDPGPLAWAAGLEVAAVLAAVLAWLLPRRRAGAEGPALALEIAAHALAAGAVLALLGLDGFERTALKLPLAVLVGWWLARRRWQAYGAVLVLGVAESVVRRVWEADLLEPGTLATLTATLCWAPAAALALARRRDPRAGAHWLHAALGLPSAWLGALAALVAAPLLVLPADPGPEVSLAVPALCAMLLLGAWLAAREAEAFEAAAWTVAVGAGLRFGLASPEDSAWLLPLAPGLALLAALRPSRVRAAATTVAVGAALLAAAAHGLPPALDLLLAAAVAAALRAWRAPRGWSEVALVLAVLLGLATLERLTTPGLGWQLVAVLAAAALLRPAASWAPAARVGRALVLLGAAAWALHCAVLACGEGIGAWAVGLAAAVLLLLAWDLPTWARGLAPWAASAVLLALDAPAWTHPAAWLGIAGLAWLPSARAARDRAVAWTLCALTAAGLAWVAVAEPEARPILAPAWALLGLLLAHVGRARAWAWAWAALGVGLLCAAAQPALVPALALARATLALASVAWASGPRSRAVAAGALAVLGFATGAWPLAGLALAAGAVRAARPGTAAPAVAEPAAWVLLAAGVALRVAGCGGVLELALLALAVPALGWGRPWLVLASLPLLCWLPGEILGITPTLAWPLALAAVGLGLALARSAVPACADLCLGLAGLLSALALAGHGPVAFLALAALLAAGAWVQARRDQAAAWLLLGGFTWLWLAWGAWTALPALWALLAVAAADRLGSAWFRALALVALVAACLLEGASDVEIDPSGWQRAALGLVFVLAVARTLRGSSTHRWWGALAWGGLLLAVLRIHGPLDRIPDGAILPLLVGVGTLLEGAALGLEPRRGAAFVTPLRRATATLAALALASALLSEACTTLGVALAGCLFGLRFVLRSRSGDLLAALALLDLAAVLLALDLGWRDPLAFVGPVGLSLVALAQVLRATLDPRVRDLVRWTGALAIYLTAFGQAVFDPSWTLGLVLLGLAGLAAGSALRVRALLTLGSGAVLAALLTELLRFGLNHSRFWAFYLTTLGLFILGGMVALTLLRPQLAALRGQVREHLDGWE